MMRLALSALLLRTTALLMIVFVAFLSSAEVGDPVHQLVSQHASQSEREQLHHKLGLDQPVHERFTAYIVRIVNGDLGHSLKTGEPVSAMLRRALPVSLDLCIAATCLALLLALPLGVLATTSGTGPTYLPGAILAATASFPVFVLAILAMAVFSTGLGILPPSGTGRMDTIAGWTTGLLSKSGLAALALPALVAAIPLSALFAGVLRMELETIQKKFYITAAHARGLPRRYILRNHALANAWPALIPVITIQAANLMAFAIVTETTFQRPGLGWLIFKAMENADGPVLVGAILLAGLTFWLFGLLADLLLLLADPRLRVANGRPRGTEVP
jgi:peptide/nickel transport system permease protein